MVKCIFSVQILARVKLSFLVLRVRVKNKPLEIVEVCVVGSVVRDTTLPVSISIIIFREKIFFF